VNRIIYVLKRLALGVPVLIFGLTMSFFIVKFAPLDPVLSILGQDAQPEDIRQLEIALNLRYPDGELIPLWDQYLRTMTELLTLNFGQSHVVQTNTPALDLIVARMPATIWLGFWSVVIALFIGIPLGLYAGLRSNTWGDYLASGGGIIWRAMPNFWLAVMLAGLMSGTGALSFYRNLPPKTDVIGTSNELQQLLSGIDVFGSIPILEMFWIPIPNFWPMLTAFKWILPAALVLGSASMGNEVRIGRTAVLESINAKYIDTAKAKGLRNRSIIGKHVGRNAMIPLLPVIMGEFYLLIGGSVIVESVFSINGLGNLFLRSLFAPDIPVLMALLFIFIIIQILFNITQDLLYTFIDPRITLGGGNR
jgi:peptide/nickel transport system permease protein